MTPTPGSDPWLKKTRGILSDVAGLVWVASFNQAW